MALSSGAGLHQAWISAGGGTFLLLNGSVEQHASRRASTFSVTLPMDGAAESTFASLGSDSVQISVLTRGQSAVLLVGVIDAVDMDYITRRIRVSGRDLSALLSQNMTSEKWVNKKGSEIVADLAGRVGLGFQGDSSTVMAGKKLTDEQVKLSDNVTFAYIIQKCAELDGARWWVDAESPVLHYVVFGNPSGVYTVNYQFTGIEVISDASDLRVSVNVQASKDIDYTVKSWHPYDKQVYQSDYSIGGTVSGSLKYNNDLPNLKQDHTQQHAKARAEEVARHRIRVEASVAGDPSCNVNQMLQLNGTDFAGSYEIDTVTHHFGMTGHRTNITARSFPE